MGAVGSLCHVVRVLVLEIYVGASVGDTTSRGSKPVARDYVREMEGDTKAAGSFTQLGPLGGAEVFGVWGDTGGCGRDGWLGWGLIRCWGIALGRLFSWRVHMACVGFVCEWVGWKIDRGSLGWVGQRQVERGETNCCERVDR